MDNLLYKVFAMLDDHKGIENIKSTAFFNEQKLIEQGYIKIDEGTDGVIYGHAEPNYLLYKHKKSIFDEYGKPNFKFQNEKVIELTKEEKEELYPTEPSEQDLINADLYMQIAQLQMSGINLKMLSNSPRYELLKKYYDMGIYNNENMKIFVSCGWITQDEYDVIIGLGES